MYEVVIKFDDDSIAKSMAAMIRDTHGLMCEVRSTVAPAPDPRWEAVRAFMATCANPTSMMTDMETAAATVVAAIDAGRGKK